MTIRSREMWPIDKLPTYSDDQILRIWDRVLSGEADREDEWFAALCHETWQCRSLAPKIDMHKGELKFTVSEEDEPLKNHESVDPWVPPDSTRNDFSYILCYAQSFNGYRHAERDGLDLDKFANDYREEYYKSGKLPADFVSLRCCLFFEIRVQRSEGLSEEHWRYIQDLFKATCVAFAAEAPSRPARLAEFNRELQARIDALDRGERVTSEEALRHFRKRSAQRRKEISEKTPEP